MAAGLDRLPSMRRIGVRLILGLLAAGAAQAHFSLVAPASIHANDNGGKGELPCGEGVESGIVTPDPDVMQDANGISINAAIQKPEEPPVLASSTRRRRATIGRRRSRCRT